MKNYLEKTKQQRTYDLSTLLFRNLLGFFIGKIVHSDRLQFPKTIGTYKFESDMKKTGPRKSYLLAIYKNNRGQKAIAKMRDARIKAYHYYSLLNEIVMYKILNSAMRRLKNKIPSRFSDIYIPKFLNQYEDDKMLVSLVEFVDGKIAEDLSPEKTISVFFKMVDFLNFMGKHLNEEEKKNISKRTPIDYLFFYPLLAAKAVVTYPKSTPHVIRGIPVFLRALPAIFSSSKHTLVHRDLHFMNIIISKDRVTLIDLQQCVYTEPLHELITTLRYWWKGWKDERFGKLLLAEIINRYSNRTNFKKLFQGFAVNSATHGLTGPGFSRKTINGWIDFLDFAINPKFEKYTKI